MVKIETAPSIPERWDDVVTAFGRRGDDASWCWCQRFLDRPVANEDAPDNRSALHREISTARSRPG